MQPHDNDNIPVLEDIIYEHDDQPGAPATNEKQKPLWDDEIEESAAAAEAVATPDEYARDEPDFTSDSVDSVGEIPADSDTLSIDEPVALLRYDEPGDPGNVAVATAFDDADDVIQPYPDAATDDVSFHAAPAPVVDSPPPQAGQIDIDELADRILRQLIPDLEDYLLDRIRHALESALDNKTHD
jgi:hypothetical protein